MFYSFGNDSLGINEKTRFTSLFGVRAVGRRNDCLVTSDVRLAAKMTSEVVCQSDAYYDDYGGGLCTSSFADHRTDAKKVDK